MGKLCRRNTGVMLLIAFCSSFSGHSQTGPAGVSNSASNPLWLKADAGTSTTTNGVGLSFWNDQSGNANNASQATPTKQPLYQASIINGIPAILFNNASPNDELSIPDNDNLDNTAGLTILTVTRPLNLDGSARAPVSKRTGVGNNESYLIFYYTSNQINVDIDGNGDRFNTVMAFVNNNNYIIDLLYDGTLPAASRAKVYINENLDVTNTETSAAIPNYNSPATIGSLNIGDGRPFGGYIAEIIIYRKALNNAERFIVDNYLSSKYNITLTANDLYAGDTPANGDYDYEVAGVGMDATGSNTSSASSISGGLSVAQASGFQNGDYLLYGHTSAVNSTNTSDVSGMTGANNGRWNRIWYIDVTNAGATENINLVFDMSDAGTPVTPVTASNYVLLYRAGQSGSWTELAVASSISGDQISFPGVTVTNDGYYTLGSHDIVNSPLPIQLLDFTGQFNGSEVELSWSTATEINNDFFTVEKSINGQDFISLLELPGAGTSVGQKNYSATDYNPYPGRSYYRLDQTDFDRQVTQSHIISVATYSSPISMQLYPNPASAFINVKISGNYPTVCLSIYNAQGESISFVFSKTEDVYTIVTQNFRKGLYIIKFFDGNHWGYEKFVVE
jgi:hypothetical protein